MADEKRDMRAVLVILWLAGVVLIVAVLIFAAAQLIPLAVAVMLWFLIDALADGIAAVPLFGRRIPQRWSVVLALLMIVGIGTMVVNVIAQNVAAVAQNAAFYEQNLQRLVHSITEMIGAEHAPTFDQFFANIDIQGVIIQLAATVSNFAGDAGIVLVYVFFMMAEQQFFDAKLRALFPDKERQNKVRFIFLQMSSDVKKYIWIMTLVSIATGLISYIAMRIIGLDFAEFWAFLIFLLNYIPTIGSILGTAFPTLLALVQFETFGPFLFILVTIGATQVIVGNVVQPRMMGKTLNISPLVVIISLLAWGAIWGVAGMFLCMPITVILMIIFTYFPQTRPIAILLSADGNIQDPEHRARAS